MFGIIQICEGDNELNTCGKFKCPYCQAIIEASNKLATMRMLLVYCNISGMDCKIIFDYERQ